MTELHERASVWRCGAKVFEIDRLHPLIMGILNVTPDSFSDGGTHNGLEDEQLFEYYAEHTEYNGG